MAELGKVLNALENCTAHPKCRDCGWKECEYEHETVEIPLTLAKDAHSLLKAQEPILLENQHKPYGHIINANSPWISRCPKCGKKIEGKQTRFCKYCGQAVKWNENNRP